MRELKFRAWDTFNADYFCSDKMHSLQRYARLAEFFAQCSFAEAGGNGIVIEQYTGLEDYQGNEIWEGDILCHPDGTKFVVEWEHSGFRAFYKGDPNSSSIGLQIGDKGKAIVVGNIHESDYNRYFGGVDPA